MRVGIIVAMDKEFDLIEYICKDCEKVERRIRYGCKFMMFRLPSKDEIVIMRCGIGKVNATIGVMLLREMDVKCIISSGVAGSLKKSISPGMIVVGTEYRYHDVYCGNENELGQVQGEPATFKADKFLLDISLWSGNQDILHGLILTGDCFIDKQDVAEDLHDKYPLACAVDMESCAIAQVCHKIKMPFLSYRVISDNILNPSAISYSEFWKETPLKMALCTLSYVGAVFNSLRYVL